MQVNRGAGRFFGAFCPTIREHMKFSTQKEGEAMATARLIGLVFLSICISFLLISEPIKADVSPNFYSNAWSEWSGNAKITVVDGDVVIKNINHLWPDETGSPGYDTKFAYSIDIGDNDPNNPEVYKEIYGQSLFDYDDIFEGEAYFDVPWQEQEDPVEKSWTFTIEEPHMASATTSAVEPNNFNTLWAFSTAEIDFIVEGQGTIQIEIPYVVRYDLKTVDSTYAGASCLASIALFAYETSQEWTANNDSEFKDCHDGENQYIEESGTLTITADVGYPPAEPVGNRGYAISFMLLNMANAIKSEPTNMDDDLDGVTNDDDQCPDTVEGDVVDENGCSIDQLCPCENAWKNHGKYVSCVSHAAGDFVSAGLIDNNEIGQIVSQAAQSDCGKKKK